MTIECSQSVHFMVVAMGIVGAVRKQNMWQESV